MKDEDTNTQNKTDEHFYEKNKDEILFLSQTLPASQYPSFNRMILKYLIILIKTRIQSIKITLSKEVESRKFIWRDGVKKRPKEERIEFEFHTSGVFHLEISSSDNILRSYGTYIDKGKKIELKYFSYQSQSGFYQSPEAMNTDYISIDEENIQSFNSFNYKGKQFNADFSSLIYDKKLPYLAELEANKIFLNAKYSSFTLGCKSRSYYFRDFIYKENKVNYSINFLSINITFYIFGIIEIKIFNNYSYDSNSIFAIGTYELINNEEDIDINIIQDNNLIKNYIAPYKKNRDEILFKSKYFLKNTYKKSFEFFNINDAVMNRFLNIDYNLKFSYNTLNSINFLLEKAEKKKFVDEKCFEYYIKEDWNVNSSKITFYPEGIFYKFDWMAGKDYSFEEYFVGVYFCDNLYGNIKLVGFHSDSNFVNSYKNGDLDNLIENEYPDIVEVQGSLNDEEIICRFLMKKI
jgi:hypothetical protein